MNKKGYFIVLAVLAFVAGQGFLEYALAAAGAPAKTFAEFIIPVAELLIGGVLGYFFKKTEDSEIINNLNESLSKAKSEIVSLKEAAKSKKIDAVKTLSKKSSK